MHKYLVLVIVSFIFVLAVSPFVSVSGSSLNIVDYTNSLSQPQINSLDQELNSAHQL